MQLSQFAKAPRGPYLFDFWVHPVTVPSPLGEFSVELYPEVGEPDGQMVEEANKLAVFVRSYPEKTVAKVFAHYQQMLEHPNWLASCQVPTDLRENDLAPYMQALNLVVNRDGHPNQFVYGSLVYISPQWDTEHAIYLEINSNEVFFATHKS